MSLGYFIVIAGFYEHEICYFMPLPGLFIFDPATHTIGIKRIPTEIIKSKLDFLLFERLEKLN